MSENKRNGRHGKKQNLFQKAAPVLIGAVVLLLAAVALYGVFQANRGKLSANQTGNAQVKKEQAPSSDTTKDQEEKTVASETTTSKTNVNDEDVEAATKDSKKLRVAKGKNHNEAAKDYAYDPKWVQDVVDGRAVNDGQRLCFLTFDDGVNHEVTPQILDVLKKEQVHATFFVVGNTIGDKTKDILERQISEGNSIGIHSFDHDYDKLYPGRTADSSRIAKEAEDTQAALKKQLGQDFQTTSWRYPGGHMSWHNMVQADDALAAQGLHWVDWNAMSGDAEPASTRPKTADEMVAYQEKSITEYPDVKLRVVLMHDAADKQVTVAALPRIIQFYRDKGFKFGILE